MRAIKFKIWNKRLNVWHHQEPINLFGEVIIMGEILNPNLSDDEDGLYKKTYKGSLDMLNDLVPLQFTGLLDKNGAEIYPKDVLRNQSDGSAFEIGDWPENYNTLAAIQSGILTVEVIGNIWENPDLINKGDN